MVMMEHARSTGVLPDWDAREMNQAPPLPVYDPRTRTRRMPLVAPRPAERGAFFFAEVCMIAFTIVVLHSLFGEPLRDAALAPLRTLSNTHNDNLRAKYATSIGGLGLEDFSRVDAHTRARQAGFYGGAYGIYDGSGNQAAKAASATQADPILLGKGESLIQVNIDEQKGYLCLKIPDGPLPSTYLSPSAGATVEEGALEIMQPLLNTLAEPLEAGAARKDGTCGDTAADTTVMVLLYHKMGTVWWNHSTRTSDYAHWSSVFTVDAGADDALLFLQVAADLAASDPRLRKKFPAILMVNNPTLENVQKLYDLTLQAGRQPKIVLQVRDFRDVLMSGYKYHQTHTSSDVTSEAWLHTPQTYWGEAVGSKSPVSYQDALKSLPVVAGATLEMEMVEDVWKSIALVAHDPVLSQHAAFVTYEKMWDYPGDVVTQLVRFMYGDVRCNESANKLARGFLAYTAGFRAYTQAGEAAHTNGDDFDPNTVDLTPVIELIKAEGTPVESAAKKSDLLTFFRTTYGNAGKHFRSGAPGKWRTDPAFDTAVATVFAQRFQCLLDAFKFEVDDSWVANRGGLPRPAAALGSDPLAGASPVISAKN